jgi:copper homeostasis protein
VALGFRRILTSGGGVTVDAGTIGALVGRAAGRIVIMPGAGVTPAHAALLKGLGVSDLHGSCSVGMAVQGPIVDFGFGPALRRQTDAALVRAMKQAMEEERQWTSP